MSELDIVLKNLHDLKLWIIFKADGDVTCGEIRQQLRHIDGAIDFIKREKVCYNDPVSAAP